VEVATFGKILGNFSPIFPPSAAGVRSRRFRRGGHLVAGVGTFKSLVLQVGGFDVPLTKVLCKNLPAENTQRQLSRPKPTRVAVPIEEEEDI